MQARFYILRRQRELNMRNHSASAFERKEGEPELTARSADRAVSAGEGRGI